MATDGVRTVSAHDVAKELRRRLPTSGVVKVHKLLYYCQGWHLTWAGVPLFEERIEAWPNGPVVASLWADERHGRSLPPARDVEDPGLRTIDYVVRRYGAFSGKELIRRTHLEDPWIAASEADDPNPEIDHHSLAAWFSQDDDHAAHIAEVKRLRARMEQPFGHVERTDDMDAAIERALQGHTLVETRPSLTG